MGFALNTKTVKHFWLNNKINLRGSISFLKFQTMCESGRWNIVFKYNLFVTNICKVLSETLGFHFYCFVASSRSLFKNICKKSYSNFKI